MFKFGKAALYERMLREKDRQNDILAEQIDYLRARLAQLESQTVPLIGKTFRPDESDIPAELLAAQEKDPNIEIKPYVSDEELDALALLESGRIVESELPDVLKALGMTPELEFESVG